MATGTKIFKSNQSQAVRLPRAVAFPEGVTEVEIVAIGASRVISPIGHRWDSFFGRSDRPSDDFGRADQGSVEEREQL